MMPSPLPTSTGAVHGKRLTSANPVSILLVWFNEKKYKLWDTQSFLMEFIAYRSKVGTTDIANDAKQFESRFYLHEKSLTNKPTE